MHILNILATISIQKDNKGGCALEQVFLVSDTSLKLLVNINLWLSFHLPPIAPQPGIFSLLLQGLFLTI